MRPAEEIRIRPAGAASRTARLTGGSRRDGPDAIALRSEGGLSGLRVHQLHLHAGRHAAPVAALGLHLVLDGANGIHSTEQVS